VEREKKQRAFGEIESPFDFVVGDARLERAAFGSGDQRSIHLS
jgi:hypothetical protein